jgi:hypothetical protein
MSVRNGEETSLTGLGRDFAVARVRSVVGKPQGQLPGEVLPRINSCSVLLADVSGFRKRTLSVLAQRRAILRRVLWSRTFGNAGPRCEMRNHVLPVNRPCVRVIGVRQSPGRLVVDEPTVDPFVLSQDFERAASNTPCIFVAISSFPDFAIWKKGNNLCLAVRRVEDEYESATAQQKLHERTSPEPPTQRSCQPSNDAEKKRSANRARNVYRDGAYSSRWIKKISNGRHKLSVERRGKRRCWRHRAASAGRRDRSRPPGWGE